MISQLTFRLEPTLEECSSVWVVRVFGLFGLFGLFGCSSAQVFGQGKTMSEKLIRQLADLVNGQVRNRQALSAGQQ